MSYEVIKDKIGYVHRFYRPIIWSTISHVPPPLPTFSDSDSDVFVSDTVNMACRSAISRQHIAPHRLHLHQLLTDETTDLDSYEVHTTVIIITIIITIIIIIMV